MKPWIHIETAFTPQDTELSLWHRDTEIVIRADGRDLMSNRMHGSEEEMATLSRANRPGARVLVGGLGMGYTLRAALNALPEGGRVTVVELSEAVVKWNREQLGHLADHPLNDPRTDLVIGDVGDTLVATPGKWDAILLDVDNGPNGFTQPANDRLYGVPGLNRARMALRQPGTLVVWSAYEDPAFERRLHKAGMQVRVARVRARGAAGGPKHVIFVGWWG